VDRFELVFRRSYPRLVTLAWRVLADRGEAEDVAQETLARLADAAILDRPDDEVDAWLTRVCLNRAANALRGRRRACDREDRAGRREPPPDAPDPAGTVVAGEDRDAVRAALALLPERQRAVLVLRHSGYRYAEIAAAVGVAPGSVGTLLARAERAFRAAFVPAQPQERPQDSQSQERMT
jgi:RNA polymerase sigma-70 factor (ECF subfamily)